MFKVFGSRLSGMNTAPYAATKQKTFNHKQRKVF
jgi:hypothetical protein